MNAKTLFGLWSDVREGLMAALGQLTDEQLSFTPREGLWSLGETVCHIAGCEDGWFRHVVTHELPDWEGADYSLADYPAVEDLVGLLGEVHARVVAYVDPLTDADLDRVIELPWGPKVPLWWVFWHILEHEIHHRGEVYLMLGLQGMEAPDV